MFLTKPTSSSSSIKSSSSRWRLPSDFFSFFAVIFLRVSHFFVYIYFLRLFLFCVLILLLVSSDDSILALIPLVSNHCRFYRGRFRGLLGLKRVSATKYGDQDDNKDKRGIEEGRGQFGRKAGARPWRPSREQTVGKRPEWNLGRKGRGKEDEEKQFHQAQTCRLC